MGTPEIDVHVDCGGRGEVETLERAGPGTTPAVEGGGGRKGGK